jgi:hypothetical protein
MLHAVDQLVKQAPDETGEENGYYAVPPAEDSGKSQDCWRYEMRQHQFIRQE